MIQCNPAGICSWNFRLKGAASEEVATLEFNWMSEQGTIITPSVGYEVVKEGMLRGEWRLLRQGLEAAVGKKTSAFTRRFEIEFDNQSAVLQAQSAFSRTMTLSTPSGSGRITPVHPFTRRATMEIPGMPLHVQCFAFWLTALMWKRAANSSAASS